MPKVLIAGASGFLGSKLCQALKLDGYEVAALERHKDFLENTDRVIRWDGRTTDSWIEELDGAEVLINLSGKNIACKWTEENKRTIRESRIGPTQLLSQACTIVSAPPTVWLNMSATGIYRPNLDEPLDESGPASDSFMGQLVQDWEAAFFDCDLPNTNRIALRTAPVFGNGAGAYDVFVKLVKWFVGGPAGSGRQWMSWIHVDDWVRLAMWTIKGSRAEGQGSRIYNACSPSPVRSLELMAALRKAYGRPWAPPVPAFAVKLFGTLGGPDPSLALDGYRVFPKKALDEGFEFRFPTLADALVDLAPR